MSHNLTLKRTITIASSVSKVWTILTDSDCIKQFYFGFDWKTDWKKGSTILITGMWDRESFEDKGTVVDIEFEKFILFNLLISGTQKPVNIRYELENVNNATLLTIYQYDFENEALVIATQSKWDNVLAGIKMIAEK